jgi:hypothetical protein
MYVLRRDFSQPSPKGHVNPCGVLTFLLGVRRVLVVDGIMAQCRSRSGATFHSERHESLRPYQNDGLIT